jgi:hypothetical protein
MMTREQFIKRMSLIQNFHSEQDTLQVVIDKLTDGYCVVTMGDYIITEMINMIEEDIGYKDILGWWLYEDVEKVIYESDGSKKYIVRTLDELYDYMVANSSKGVYCTQCKHFKVSENNDDYFPYCKYQTKCDIFDCEDSRTLRERPYYNY